MTAIKFTVPAVPVAQPRQQHRVVNTKDGGQFVQNYMPTKHPVNAFKASVQAAAKAAYNGASMGGPISITIGFQFPRPGRLMWKKRPMPRCYHTSKPDIDNCVKAVTDALLGLTYRDDSQIAYLVSFKQYAAGDEQPSVSVTIEEMEEAEVNRAAPDAEMPDMFASPESPYFLPAVEE